MMKTPTLDPSEIGFGENCFPVDFAAPNIGHVPVLIEVLHVDQRKAPGILGKIFQRIRAGMVCPSKIHFHDHQLRVSCGKQGVIGQLAIERLKFLNVIVISQPDSRLGAFLSRTIEGFCSALPAID